MRKIKIGQIGIGHNHGEGKMLAFRKFPERFDVIGFAEEDESWLDKRGSLSCYQGLKRMSVPELLNCCEAVIVETAVSDLTRTATTCVAAKKHIHMDKPASGTLDEFRHMLDTAKENDLVVQMGYMYRYNPAVRRAIEEVKSGRLGEIYSINAEMSTNHSPEYRNWLKQFPGGIQYILGSHLVDLIVYLLGEPLNITSFLKHSGRDGVDVADNNLSVLEYERALARVFVSSVEINGWGRRQFVVCGSKGSISIIPMENPIQMTWSDTSIATDCYKDLKQVVQIADMPQSNRYDQMVLDFYDYIIGEKENPYTYEHDYAVQKVLMRMVGGDLSKR